MKNFTALLCAVFALCGCVTKDLNVENRQKIKTLTILQAPVEEFTKPPERLTAAAIRSTWVATVTTTRLQ